MYRMLRLIVREFKKKKVQLTCNSMQKALSLVVDSVQKTSRLVVDRENVKRQAW